MNGKRLFRIEVTVKELRVKIVCHFAILFVCVPRPVIKAGQGSTEALLVPPTPWTSVPLTRSHVNYVFAWRLRLS